MWAVDSPVSETGRERVQNLNRLRHAEAGVAGVDRLNVDAREIRATEIGVAERGPHEDRARPIGIAKAGSGEIGSIPIGRPEDDAFKWQPARIAETAHRERPGSARREIPVR
jgi:hypothetical protein